MSRRKQSSRKQRRRRREARRRLNKTILKEVLRWMIPECGLFAEDAFHGNIKWTPEQLAQQALIWAWQDTKNVTNAFEMTLEICEDLNIDKAAKTYTSFLNALERYRAVFSARLLGRFQALAEETAGRFWRGRWLGADGL